MKEVEWVLEKPEWAFLYIPVILKDKMPISYYTNIFLKKEDVELEIKRLKNDTYYEWCEFLIVKVEL